MGEALETRLLSSAIAARDAAEVTVQDVRTREIERWAEKVVDSYDQDIIYRGGLSTMEVRLLLSTSRVSSTYEEVAEELASALRATWWHKRGYKTPMPLKVVVWNSFMTGGTLISATQKTRVP